METQSRVPDAAILMEDEHPIVKMSLLIDGKMASCAPIGTMSDTCSWRVAADGRHSVVSHPSDTIHA